MGSFMTPTMALLYSFLDIEAFETSRIVGNTGEEVVFAKAFRASDQDQDHGCNPSQYSLNIGTTANKRQFSSSFSRSPSENDFRMKKSLK
jgi:hypothetical protein